MRILNKYRVQSDVRSHSERDRGTRNGNIVKAMKGYESKLGHPRAGGLYLAQPVHLAPPHFPSAFHDAPLGLYS